MWFNNRFATYTAYLIYAAVLTWVILGLFFYR
jgi:hypothetical protein